MKPAIYLDVDGVLNALGHRITIKSDWGDFEVHANVVPRVAGLTEGFNLALSKSMVAALANMPADVMWLTTWRHDAALCVAPLVDAPEWPVIDYGREKGAALAQDQRGNSRPFVWVDDYEAREPNLRYFMNTPSVPYLLVKPDPYVGITRAQMNDIENFVKEHQ